VLPWTTIKWQHGVVFGCRNLNRLGIFMKIRIPIDLAFRGSREYIDYHHGWDVQQ
jgi:hypothetical protein